MKKPRKKLWKKCIAILMVFCMLFSDSPILILAEELQSGYVFDFKCTVGTEDIRIPDVHIELYEEIEETDSEGEKETKQVKVSETNGTFQLESGKKYTYDLSGSLIENIKDTITIEENKKVTIYIPKDKLKKQMEGGACYVGQSLNLQKDIDLPVSWTWKSSSEDIAKVDAKGIVQAISDGEATITKSYGEDDGITVSAKVIVKPLVQCEMEYIVEGQPIIDEDKVSINIYDSNNKVISKEEGYYNLIPGEEYYYKLADSMKGICLEDGEHKFTAPEYSKKTNKIQIPVQLIQPQLKLMVEDNEEGKELQADETINLKQNSNTTLNCENYEGLFDQENWKYAIGSDTSAIKESNAWDYTEGKKVISIQYKDNKQWKTTIEMFDQYTVKFNWNGETLNSVQNSDVKFFEKTGDDTYSKEEKGINEIEIGKIYRVSTNITGFKEKKDQVIRTSPFEKEITLKAGDIIVPDIVAPEELNGYCGGTISIKEVQTQDKTDNAENQFYQEKGFWGWKCIKENDSEKELTVEADAIDLNQAEEGIYKLTYGHGDARSAHSITVNVQKIKVDLDWDNWEKETREYNGTNIIEKELYMNNDMVLIENKSDYNISDDDKITLIGTVSSKDVGEYSTFTLTDIELSNEQLYDIKDIKEGERTIPEGGIEIVQAKIEVKDLAKIAIQYRSGEVHLKEMQVRFVPDTENQNKYIQEEFIQAVGKVTRLENDLSMCTALGVKCDAADKCTAATENILFVFAENTYIPQNYGTEMAPKYKALFYCNTTSEILKDPDMINYIKLSQGTKARSNGQYCNAEALTATLDPESKYYSKESAYDKITFLPYDQKAGEMSEDYFMNVAGSKGEDSITPNNQEQDTYYEILVANSAPDFQYSTVAAILHIIPEAQREEVQAPAESELYGYPVITLYLDVTAPNVHFTEDEELNREDNKNTFRDVDRHFDSIRFEVVNTGFPVKSIQYAFIDVTGKEITADTITMPTAAEYKTLTLSEDMQYTVTTPEKDGDYVLAVWTANEDDCAKDYLTNRFFVDRTAPQVQATYVKADGEDLTDDIKNQTKDVYSNKKIRALYAIDETHLKEVTVVIKATERDENGEEREISELQDKLKVQADQLAEDLLKNQTDVSFYFDESGNYTVEIVATDKAGLKDEQVYTFTVDTEKPNEGLVQAVGKYHEIKKDEDRKKGKVTLILEKIEEKWTQFIKWISYDVFSQEEINLVLDGSDRITPVQIYYYIADDQMTEDALDKLKEDYWNLYEVSSNQQPKVKMNQQKILYEKVVDLAGNVSYYSSQGMVTDNIAPEVELSFAKNGNANHFYNGDVTFSATITDQPEAEGNGSSGLQYIAYRIVKDGEDIETKVVYDGGNQKSADKKEHKLENVVIRASKYNSNDVRLILTAVDQAGNKKEVKKELQIDNVKPEITVSYNDQAGAKYYNHAITATITVKERNLNPDDVSIRISSTGGHQVSIGQWTHSNDIEKSDDATYTCQVKFAEDDDYTLSVDCVDLAGNQAKSAFADSFILDQTTPVIAVNYNGGMPEQNGYYNHAITATVTITEHNFNEGKVNVQLRSGEHAGGQTPGLSAFHSSGDTHTATVSFATDGIYSMRVEYVDEAGNKADSYRGNTFTVDLTDPVLEISNVADHSANKGEVKPVVTCTDTNYDKNLVSLSILGANGGELDLNAVKYSAQDIKDGQEFTIEFPKEEKLDDVYTLMASMEDKAGNKIEKSIEFSVNRYGSVYTIDKESADWLTNGECAYIKKCRPVVILETNVDEVVDENISYSLGGIGASLVNIRSLSDCTAEESAKGMYYEVSELKSGNRWYQRKYTIQADNFQQEGKYTIQIDSKDLAGNRMSNMSGHHTDNDLQIEFAIDRTAPSVVVTGAKDGEMYNEEKHVVKLDVQDNIAMDSVTVFLNGEEYGHYDEKEIAQMEDGLIPVEVGESLSMQRLQVRAVDKAGNILGQKTEGKYDASFEDFNILVTRNAFVRFLHTTWLVIVTLLAVICGILVLIIVVGKRKRNQRAESEQ